MQMTPLWTALPTLLVLLVLTPTHADEGGSAVAGALGALRVGPLQQLLPLRMWANPRRSALRPRRRDMREDTLRALLGSDFQPGWMRVRPGRAADEPAAEERGSVRALRDLVDAEVDALAALADAGPSPGMPVEARALLRAWLVRRATCPVHFVWADLGPYFWPRWLRRGECGTHGDAKPVAGLPDEDNLTTGVLREGEVDEDEEDEGPRWPSNATQSTLSCSWPPGMKCVPGRVRALHILRWHCRYAHQAPL